MIIHRHDFRADKALQFSERHLVIEAGSAAISTVPNHSTSLRRYGLAAVKSADQVALKMGNSPRKLFQNDRQLVTEQDALDWFEVAPGAPSPAQKREKREKMAAKKKGLPRRTAA